MPIDVRTAATSYEAPPPATAAEAADFDRRWTAWRAKGAAQDRAFRRKIAFVAPIPIIAVVIIYALLGR